MSARSRRRVAPDGDGPPPGRRRGQSVVALLGGKVLPLVSSRVVASLLQAVMLVLLARSIGPSEFGRVSLVLSACAFVMVFSDFGMATMLSRARSRGDDELVTAILRANRLFTIVATAGLLACAGMAALAGVLPGVLLLLPVAAGLEKNVDVALSVAVADGRIGATAMSLVIRRSVAMLFFVSAWAGGADPLAAYAAGLALGALAAQAHMRTWLRVAPARPLGLRVVLRQAVPFFVSSVAMQSRTLDVSIVAWVAGVSAAGTYSAASRLVSPFLIVASVASALVMPYSVRADTREVNRLVRILAGVGVVGCAAVLPLASFAPDVMRLVYGADFGPGGAALFWLALAFPLVAVISPLEAVLQSKGHEKRVAHASSVFAVVTLGATTVGAVVGGGSGAAAATCVAFGVRFVVFVLLADRLVPATTRAALPDPGAG